jgi:hypothetical protein
MNNFEIQALADFRGYVLRAKYEAALAALKKREA